MRYKLVLQDVSPESQKTTHKDEDKILSCGSSFHALFPKEQVLQENEMESKATGKFQVKSTRMHSTISSCPY